MNNDIKVLKKIHNVNNYVLIVSYGILSNFKILTFLPISFTMVKEEKNKQFLAIKSMFVSGSVSRMKDIETLYPTGVSKALGINHSRYIQKLYKPEEFKFKHIKDLAKLLNIDMQVILDVIIKELNAPPKAAKKKF